LKFIFWALLAANAVLLAYSQGYLGKVEGSEREPQRLKTQLASERMVMLSAAEARAVAETATAAPATPEAPPVPEPEPVATIACTQAASFAAGDARRFETRIERLGFGARQSRTSVPHQEVTSHLVYLPPNGGKDGADRRVAELKEKGIAGDYFVMQGEGPMKWAVSLGVFKTDTAAQGLMTALGKQGVRGVRVLPRGPQTTRAAWQFRDLTEEERKRVADIADDFAGVQVRACL